MFSFINWSNRILMIIFLGLIFIAFSSKEFSLAVAGFTIILGPFQFLSSLTLCSIDNNSHNEKMKPYVLCVLFFFAIGLAMIFLSEVSFLRTITKMILIFMGILPFLLSFYFTYILESMNEEQLLEK